MNDSKPIDKVKVGQAIAIIFFAIVSLLELFWGIGVPTL